MTAKEDRRKKNRKVKRLLLQIEIKYGSVGNAEGKPEFEELRKIIGIEEDKDKKDE